MQLTLSEDDLELLAEMVAEKVVAMLELVQPHNAWLNSREAAEYLGVHVSTVHRLAAAGELESHRANGPGSRLYFKSEELDQWRAG